MSSCLGHWTLLQTRYVLNATLGSLQKWKIIGGCDHGASDAALGGLDATTDVASVAIGHTDDAAHEADPAFIDMIDEDLEDQQPKKVVVVYGRMEWNFSVDVLWRAQALGRPVLEAANIFMLKRVQSRHIRYKIKRDGHWTDLARWVGYTQLLELVRTCERRCGIHKS